MWRVSAWLNEVIVSVVPSPQSIIKLITPLLVKGSWNWLLFVVVPSCIIEVSIKKSPDVGKGSGVFEEISPLFWVSIQFWREILKLYKYWLYG